MLDEFQARTGDFNGDGRLDVLVERTTPSLFIDGTTQSVILNQTSDSDLVVQVPNSAQLAAALSYPIDDDIMITSMDYNSDGYLDQTISGLTSTIGTEEDTFLLFAPGKSGSKDPLGLSKLGSRELRFLMDIVQAWQNGDFFQDNPPEIIVNYTVAFSCRALFGFETSFVACFGFPVVTDVDVQTDSDTYFQSRGVFELLNLITLNGFELADITNVEHISDIYKSVFGVAAFGFATDEATPDSFPPPELTTEDIDGDDGETSVLLRVIGAVGNWVIRTGESGVGGTLIGQGTIIPGGGSFEPGTRHVYGDRQFGVCSLGSSAACTLENVFCWSRVYNAPRPGGADNAPIEDGDDSELLGSNPVVTWVPPGRNVFINETLDGDASLNRTRHVFHDPRQTPGCGQDADLLDDGGTDPMSISPALEALVCSIVIRKTQVVNGEVIIRTIGTGENALPRSNEVWGESLFGLINSIIKSRIEDGEICTD